jgi:hypothetical protein
VVLMLLEPLQACYTRCAQPLYIIIHPLILMLAAKIGLLPKDSIEMVSSAYPLVLRMNSLLRCLRRCTVVMCQLISLGSGK